ncbi:AAA family ATPase [Sorangium atrum]|uniref:AAA family ATPase n=1 Tax=Sorangium atrum TaxID=2995308 RepID=A0ABT5CKJ1_9BACT|nr:AAA family ATPase [Sorangium aterium]MDC0685597.1 AAA family ATPase [Sorangium aterium]
MVRFDVLVCTAALDELEAVLRVFDEPPETWEEARLPNGFRYHHCAMRRPAGEPVRVAAAWVGSDGAQQSSARLQVLIEHTRPRALAICGICAGHRGAVALGDVIVADRVYRYDPSAPDEGHSLDSYALPANWAMDARYVARRFDAEGRWSRRRPQTQASQRRWLARALHAHESEGGPAPAAHPDRKLSCPDWLEVIRWLEQNGDIEKHAGALALTDRGRATLLEEQTLYPDGHPGEPPLRVHFGVLATVSSYRAGSDIFDRLRAIDRKTLGLDVEAAAFCDVAHRLDVPIMVAKAVGDFADFKSEPRFHSFAAAVSAEFALDYMLQAPLPEAAQPKPTTVSDPLADVWSHLDGRSRNVLAALAASAGATTISTVAWIARLDESVAESVVLTAATKIAQVQLAPTNARSVRLLDPWRDFVRRQPEGQQALKQHAEYVEAALQKYADPIQWRELEQDVPEVLAAVDNARAAGDNWGAYRLFMRVFDHQYRRGRYRDTVDGITQLLAHLPPESEEAIEAQNGISRGLLVLGEAENAGAASRRALALAVARGNRNLQSQSLLYLARYHYACGEFDVAARYHEEGLKLVEEPHGTWLRAKHLGELAMCELRRDDISGARERVERALDDVQLRAPDDLPGRASLLANLGMCLLKTGNPSGALERLQDALSLEERLGRIAGQAAVLRAMGSCDVPFDQTQRGIERIERALVLHEQIGALPAQVLDLMQLGECHAALDDMRQACDSWQRSIDCARRISLPDAHPDVLAVTSMLTGTGTYVTRATIQGVRSIDALTWEIPVTAGPGWHVLIGDNGAGKSSFLRSLALALVSETEAHALRQDWNEWLCRGSAEGSVYIALSRNFPDPGRASVTFDVALKLSRHADQVKLEDTSPNDLGRRLRDGTSPGLFSAAYGPFRRFSGGDSDYEKLFASLPRLARHLSLFDERPALTESIAWLKLLDHKQLEKNPEGDILDSLKAFINQPDFLPHGTKLTKVSSTAVTFTDGNGYTVGIEQLSDGHRSILSLTLELLRQLTVTYGAQQIFYPGDPTRVRAPGVVLIDEVDVHLHPTWQRAVGIWFTKHFPRIQFIVTSHSPLVCQAAEVGTVFLLPKPGTTGGRMLQGTELDRLRYGNVLDAYGTGVFGQGVTRSDSAKQMLERLAELNDAELERDLTAEEFDEQARLRATFPTTAHVRSRGER